MYRHHHRFLDISTAPNYSSEYSSTTWGSKNVSGHEKLSPVVRIVSVGAAGLVSGPNLYSMLHILVEDYDRLIAGQDGQDRWGKTHSGGAMAPTSYRSAQASKLSTIFWSLQSPPLHANQWAMHSMQMDQWHGA